MSSPRDGLTSLGLLILRVGIGCLMLVHGLAKLQDYSNLSEGFPDPLGVGHQVSLILAIGAEVGCSLLLIGGLLTRLAAIPLAFTMVVATFVVHANDAWQKKELAAVYLLVYVVLVLTGPGTLSFDHFWFGPRSDNGSTSK